MGKLQKIINLDEVQKNHIFSNLDENGRLPCIKAFKVARLIALKPKDMSDACKAVGVKITNCELGVFGKLNFQNAEPEIYHQIKQKFVEESDINCKTLWAMAKKSSLRRVGSTVKNSDAQVINCQLGCFRKREGHCEVKS